MSILLLVACAVAESVVWLWRLRAGVGASALSAGLSTVGVCVTRVVFLGAGLQAALQDRLLIGGAAYAIAAGLSTWAAHRLAYRLGDRREAFRVGRRSM